MSKLTIVIPHYNSLNSLNKLIDSIYVSKDISKKIKTIIVDDKSSVDLYSFEEKIKNIEGITLLRNATNKKGAGTCRNIGMNNTNTEWVMFADSDDYFEIGFFENIETELNSESDIVFFKVISRLEDTSELADRHQYLNQLIEEYKYSPSIRNECRLRYTWSVPWGKLLRTDMIRKHNIKFDETMVSNDVMFSIKCGKIAKKIGTNSNIIYCATKSIGSMTTSISSLRYDIRTTKKIEAFLFLKENISKDELEYLEQYALRWLINGILVYNISISSFFRYLMMYKTSGMKIFPPFKKINLIGIKRAIFSLRKDKKYSKPSKEVNIDHEKV